VRYATWELYWEPGSRYGIGPETKIGSAEGIFRLGADSHDTIFGYIYSHHSLTGLDNWKFQELSAEQALALAQQVNMDAVIGLDGKIVFPNADDEAAGEWVAAE
jgi:hypothetical protein